MLSNRPKGSRDSREVDPIEENLSQGKSTQPPHLRFPGQLADATNLTFSVVDGMSKRPGTQFDRKIGSPAMTACGNYRVHPIDRDPTERYIVLFGVSTIRVFDTINDDEATVTIDADATAYLWAGSATADDLRFLTKNDTTFILNTKVPASSMRSPTYTVTSTVRDYDVLRAITPADDTYHLTEEDVTDFPEGYYKYDVDGVTFGKVQFPAVSGIPNAAPGGYYDDGGTLQLRIYFAKTAGFTGGSFVTATKTLTKVGAFTNAVAGDRVNVTGGTGVTPGWYEIASKTSADVVVFVLDIGGANPADVAASSLSSRHDVSFAADAVLADMYAIADKWSASLRAAGAIDALCSWTDTGSSSSPSGYFTITSPYRGTGTTVAEVTSTGSGTDATTSSKMFYATGTTITAGSGSGSLTMDVDDRWTAVAAPNQADAEIDPETMPVAMTRTKKGPAATFSIDLIDWNDRTSGDEDSNPSPYPLSQALTGTITNITLASPGVVTCVGHGLVTGNEVYIHSTDSTPVIDGFRTVTRINDDTFSVAVNTTGAGTTGRWSKGAHPIADMLEISRRLAFAIDDRVVMSQTDDIYNFYIANAADVVDSDPIDIPIGSDDVAILTFMVQSQKTTILCTQSGQQFEMADAETGLTITTCKFTQTTRHVMQAATYGTRPKSLASVLYFAGKSDRSAPLWEYRRDDLTAISTATDVSKHVEGFPPSEIRTFITAPSANQVYALEENDRGLYVYQAHWEGAQKKQSAWGRWEFDGNYRISDITHLSDRVWMLVETAPPATVSAASPGVVTLANHGFSNGDVVGVFDSTTTPTLNGSRTVANVTANTFTLGVNTTTGGACRVCTGAYVLEHVTTSREQVKPAELSLAAWAYPIHMDRQIEVTGVYNGGGNYTEFTLPTGFSGLGSTLNRVVLGPAFDGSSNTGSSGDVLADTTATGCAVAVSNPAQITMTDHGLTTGNSVVISASTTTASVDGTRVVTVIDDDTFSVAVNVTVAGTATVRRHAFVYATTYVRVTGDYDAGKVVLGRFYTVDADFTRPHLRDERGNADRLAGLVVKRFIAGYVDTGSFSVTVTYNQPGPDACTTTFTPTTNAPESGELNAPVYADAAKCVVSITSATPEPLIITGIQWIADYAEGLR